MADIGSPDWWLNRLYTKLRLRQPTIRAWDDWYVGDHPAPKGYEKAGPLLQRMLETLGLNMMALVTDAALDRMQIVGFSVNGQANDDVAEIWQRNNFDLGSEMVRQEKMALSEAYVMVDPNNGNPIVTGEHPEQCIVELAPGSGRTRAAAAKVWIDEIAGGGPLVRAHLQVGDQVYGYAAPTRMTSTTSSGRPNQLVIKPAWELQPSETGANSLGEVSIVPFSNRGRMLRPPLPEFAPAIPAQKRIIKTLLDRMVMQESGAFKAKWVTGMEIPEDPETGEPVEPFQVAIDRLLVAEDPNTKFGQFEAEDIKQILEAVRDDIADCAMLVPTSPDQILGKLINVSGDGLKLAQVSEVKRVRRHIRHESEPWEDVARLMLKGAGKDVPNADRMITQWRNPEYRTDTEQANAATVAIGAGMPEEVAWVKYFNASPEEVTQWKNARAEQISSIDPAALAALIASNTTRAGGDPNPPAGS